MKRSTTADFEAQVQGSFRSQFSAESMGERKILRVLSGEGAVIEDEIDILCRDPGFLYRC
jgi:hypothetical protein